ncbi:aspartyl protease [Saccharomycopsis crataegensis]|uniref:Aspartyl protease n=1 Tax=Saccharomycopsis crataegensis TaxID=43959 RepID=A0AAV5QIF4_9ASCO|nr:aspartyl protease [Saccharomycopsis crataegensis]
MQLSSSILFTVLASLASAYPVQRTPLKLDFNVTRTVTGDIKPPSPIEEPNVPGILVKHRTTNSSRSALMRIENDYSLYVAEFGLGTPAQTFKIQIDTGSSDFFVPAVNSSSQYGTFDPSKSSTYNQTSKDFEIMYGDRTYAKGKWAYDDLTFGNVELKNIFFSAATNQTTGEGVCGIGFPTNEASNYPGGFMYDNLPVQLVNQGYISKNAYSLYLNSEEASSGSVLFGAIDHAKYQGELQTFDIVDIDDGGDKTSTPYAFYINLDSVSVNNTTYINTAYPALLDSGTTLLYAPTEVYKKVGETYGTYSNDDEGYVTTCGATGPNFDFKFNNLTISVPFKDLLFSLEDNGSMGANDKCMIGLQNAGSSTYILGDVFLRSAYVVYDLTDAKISMAQVKYTAEEDISFI